MVKAIITDYNFYNDRADEVISNDEMSTILQDLKDTIIKNKYECLAAPQIGYKNRFF